MRWLRKHRIDPAASSPAEDVEIARLTARADLIVEQLDVVVKEMSDILKSAYEAGK
jgi:hypothetical protein